MNFLQIWIGDNDPSGIRLECMKHTFDNLKPKEKYYLVSNNDIFGNKVNLIDPNSVINKTKIKFDLSEELWNSMSFYSKNDFMKCYLLSTIKDLCYVDTDLKIKKHFIKKVENQYPYISKFEFIKNKYDTILMYNNNNFKFFEDLAFFAKNCFLNNELIFFTKREIFYRITSKFVLNNKVNSIEADSYLHCSIGRINNPGKDFKR